MTNNRCSLVYYGCAYGWQLVCRPKCNLGDMLPIRYHSAAAAAAVVGRLRRLFLTRTSLRENIWWMSTRGTSAYLHDCYIPVRLRCHYLVCVCPYPSFVCGLCACVALWKVVEKLNLLESSNGTVLHSEIVGAVKMKVRGMPSSVTCRSLRHFVVALSATCYYSATALLQADSV